MRIIGGSFRSRRFVVPKNITARPTTDFARENLFNVLQNRLDFEEVVALDLFAGTGAISLELVSRGAERVISVESHDPQFSFLCKVMRELKIDSILPVKGDALRYIKSTKEQFDFIFADPPYDLKDLAHIPRLVLDNNLLKEGGLFVIEHSKNNDFSALPEYLQKRVYGSVNFSFFSK